MLYLHPSHSSGHEFAACQFVHSTNWILGAPVQDPPFSGALGGGKLTYIQAR